MRIFYIKISLGHNKIIVFYTKKTICTISSLDCLQKRKMKNCFFALKPWTLFGLHIFQTKFSFEMEGWCFEQSPVIAWVISVSQRFDGYFFFFLKLAFKNWLFSIFQRGRALTSIAQAQIASITNVVPNIMF